MRSSRCAAAAAALLAAALLVSPPARAAAAEQRPLPSSLGAGATLYARSAAAFASPPGSRPLLVLLRGFACPFTAQQLSSVPNGAQYLATHLNLGPGVFTGAGAAGALQLPDDIGAALASSAADSLDIVATALTAPHPARGCTICAQAAAAASAAPAGSPERDFTLAGAALLSNVTASGAADCPAWDAGPACCQTSPAPAGDVPFVLGAIDAAIAAAPAVNRSNVVVMGFSAGAFMALRVACDAPPGRVAAVVAYAGRDANPNPGACAPGAPPSVLLVDGRQDLEVPFGGAPALPGAGAAVLGAEATLANWARRGRCASTPQKSTASPGGTTVEVVTYPDCANGRFVQGWWVGDWSHMPPRGSGPPLLLQAVRRALGRG